MFAVKQSVVVWMTANFADYFIVCAALFVSFKVIGTVRLIIFK